MMASTALFAVGLAFYTNNNMNAMNKLLDSDVEALSDGEAAPSNPYAVYGEYPNRIIVDTQTHQMVLEGKSQAYDDDGNSLNGCKEEFCGTCIMDTSSPAYNASVVVSIIKTALEGISSAVPFIGYLTSLIRNK